MGGKNPYIEETKFTPATKKYKITFIKDGQPIEVDPAQSSLRSRRSPWQHPRYLAGLPQRSRPRLRRRLRLLHVPRDRSRRPRSCNEATEAELDQLDEAPGVTRNRASAASASPTAQKTSS